MLETNSFGNVVSGNAFPFVSLCFPTTHAQYDVIYSETCFLTTHSLMQETNSTHRQSVAKNNYGVSECTETKGNAFPFVSQPPTHSMTHVYRGFPYFRNVITRPRIVCDALNLFGNTFQLFCIKFYCFLELVNHRF